MALSRGAAYRRYSIFACDPRYSDNLRFSHLREGRQLSCVDGVAGKIHTDKDLQQQLIRMPQSCRWWRDVDDYRRSRSNAGSRRPLSSRWRCAPGGRVSPSVTLNCCTLNPGSTSPALTGLVVGSPPQSSSPGSPPSGDFAIAADGGLLLPSSAVDSGNREQLDGNPNASSDLSARLTAAWSNRSQFQGHHRPGNRRQWLRRSAVTAPGATPDLALAFNDRVRRA